MEEVVAVFEEDHGGPADRAGVSLAGDADLRDEDVHEEGADGDLQDRRNKGDGHIAHATHEALHRIRDAREDDGVGLYGQVAHAETDHFLTAAGRCEELDQRMTEE